MTVAMVRKGPLGLGFRHQLLNGNMQSNIHRITAATVEALTLFLKRQFVFFVELRSDLEDEVDGDCLLELNKHILSYMIRGTQY